MARLIIILLLILIPFDLFSQPKHEVRAVWLTTIGGIDWPHTYAASERSIAKQKQELRQTLDRLQAIGINTVLLQTRIRATTIFPSAYEPWDGCLSGHPGRSPGYDALQFAISECHKRGMEIHAWIVTIPVGRWNSLGCQQLRKRMPNTVVRIGDEGFMNPEKAQTATYLADFCAEIVRNYDVDGIHLDYIRYPETWRMKVSKQVGRDHITNIVRAISRKVKSLKPWVKMSCSPVGKYDDLARYSSHGWNAYSTVCQDAQKWLKDGLMDALFPMMYFRGNQFYPFAADWKENSCGRIVAPGLGIYFMSPKEKNWSLKDITRELEVLRGQGIGHAYFRSKFLTDNTKGIYDYAKNRIGAYPSLVPPMTWEESTPPPRPRSMRRQTHIGGTDMLVWQPVGQDSTMVSYNIYSSRSYPVDTDDARNIMLVRAQKNSLIIPRDATRYYAVTAVDRYGNESGPIQEQHEQDGNSGAFNSRAFLNCDGRKVELPDDGGVLDADYILIETLMGQTVGVQPYNRETADVSNVSDGVYVLRSLGKKGRNHRLGCFRIRRSF